MSKKFGLPIIFAASTLFQISPVVAQDNQPATQPDNEVSTLEEVTVTARKRKESYLDAPVVTVILTKEMLEQYKTDNMYSLAMQVPGLLLGDSVNSTGTQLSLRGVGTMAFNATMDQSVMLDVDGMPLTQSLAYTVATFDLQQVQVFKGPQPIYFGKNATSGVISMRSVDPTDEVERIVRVGYEYEAKEKQADVIFSGPVGDTVKMRLAMRYSDQDGYFENAAVADPGMGGLTPTQRGHYPHSDYWIARGTLLWDPNEQFSARLKVNYEDFHTDSGSPLQLGYCPEGIGGIPPLNYQFIMLTDACKIDREFNVPDFDPAAFPTAPNGGKLFTDRKQGFASLELSYEFGNDLTLDSVTGYYDIDYFMMQPGNTTGTIQVLAAPIGFTNSQFTEEVRLTSNSDSPFNWMVGGFFQDGEMKNDVLVLGNTVFLGGLPPIIQHPVYYVDNRSYSLFGQVIWDVTDQWELAVGARWSDEKRSLRQFNYGPNQGPIGEVERTDTPISSSHVAPDVTLTYKPSDTLTVFGSYRVGYKSGSFNTISFIPATVNASFDDEKASGGELGIKFQSDDGRLRGELAGYYYKYNDLQVGGLEKDVNIGFGAPLLRILNASKATVQGVDFDFIYSLAAVEGMTLNGSLNYNDSTYDSFPNAQCGGGQTISEGCDQILNDLTGLYTAQDLAGRELVRAPEWAASLGLNHGGYLNSGWQWDYGLYAVYVDSYSTVLQDLPGFVQDSFVKFNANVSFTSANDRWNFALIGLNLNDEITTGWCANANVQNSIFGGTVTGGEVTGAAGHDEATCFADRGRQVWARVSLSF